VTLKQAFGTSQTLNWSVAGFDYRPAAGSDFVGGTLPTGAVTFAPGETSKVITVNVAGDTTVEENESFVVTITDPSGLLGVGTVQAEGTIVDDDFFSVSVWSTMVSAFEGNAGTTQFTFTAILNRASGTTQNVGWAVAGSSLRPADGADFVDGVLPSGTVVFAPGETSKTFTLAVAGDTLVEASETFVVDLVSLPQALVTGVSQASATIVNDDSSVVSIFPLSASTAEGHVSTTAFTFSVTLDRATSSVETVSWEVQGASNNPAAAVDFAGSALPSGALTFGIGETSKTITLLAATDTVAEPDEGFTVTLSNPTSALTIGVSSASGTILNDDALVSIVATDAVKAEGNAGTTAFTFTVTQSGDTTAVHTVAYAIAGTSNPADGADFAGGVLPSGIATFGVGETSKTITINVVADTIVEASEGFMVTLSNPSNGLVLVAPSANGTILNDDSSVVSIAPLSASKPEGHVGMTAFTFSVTLNQALLTSETVNWTLQGSGLNSASAADFAGSALPSGTLTFGIGETSKTITLLAATDTVVEPDEGFTVTLSNPTSALTIGIGSSSGTIVNDDALVSIGATDAIKAEGNAGTTAFTFTVTQSGDTITAHTVAYAVSGTGGNPADAADFASGVLPTGSVTFGVGDTSKTITINVAADTVLEAAEGFSVTLSSPSTGLVLGTSMASGTILNDDAGISIAPLSAVKAEGNSGTTAFTFLVTQTGDTTQARSVSYEVTGSDTNPANSADFADLELPLGTISFAEGETSKTLTLNIAGDTLVEADETFMVSLSNPSGGVKLGTASATGTILTDDMSVSLAAALAVVAEGNAGSTAFTFTITRTGDTSVSHSVSYSVVGSGDHPAGGADFAGGVLPSGRVTFAVGEATRTIVVNVVGNTTVETDESFTMTLSNPSAGLALGTASATGTILNDDVSIAISALSAVKAEGHVGLTPFTFTLTQTGDTSVSHSVGYAVTGMGVHPADAVDFVGGVLASGVVSFAVGETSKMLTVDVQGDTGAEAGESFIVTLSTIAPVISSATTSNFGMVAATGQTLGISLTMSDFSVSISEVVQGFVSRFGGTGGGQYNIAFVIDRSGSTAGTFTGAQTIPDLNGDGQPNTILDAEIAGFEALLQSINDLGLGSANVAVISFDSHAMTNIETTAGADTNKNGVFDIVETLHGLKSGDSTNYEAGLQAAEAFFGSSPVGQNVLFFLSDGFPDSEAAYADEVSRLLAAKTDIRAYGVGSGASQPALDLVDDGLQNKSATIILDPSQLKSGLQGSGVTLAEIAQVELLVNG